ncbi:MAG: hypothetical protein WCO85_08365 [Actinomycetes bacterium]
MQVELDLVAALANGVKEVSASEVSKEKIKIVRFLAPLYDFVLIGGMLRQKKAPLRIPPKWGF